MGRTSLLTLSLLINLVERNPSIKSRSINKIRITKEVFSIAEKKNMVIAMTPLPKVPILFPKRKKKTFFKSNPSFVRGKVILLPSISRKKI